MLTTIATPTSWLPRAVWAGRGGLKNAAVSVLDRALADAYGDGAYDNYEDLPPDRRAAIARAVEEERRHIDVDRPRYLSR